MHAHLRDDEFPHAQQRQEAGFQPQPHTLRIVSRREGQQVRRSQMGGRIDQHVLEQICSVCLAMRPTTGVLSERWKSRKAKMTDVRRFATARSRSAPYMKFIVSASWTKDRYLKADIGLIRPPSSPYALKTA